MIEIAKPVDKKEAQNTYSELSNAKKDIGKRYVLMENVGSCVDENATATAGTVLELTDVVYGVAHYSGNKRLMYVFSDGVHVIILSKRKVNPLSVCQISKDETTSAKELYARYTKNSYKKAMYREWVWNLFDSIVPIAFGLVSLTIFVMVLILCLKEILLVGLYITLPFIFVGVFVSFKVVAENHIYCREAMKKHRRKFFENIKDPNAPLQFGKGE